MAGMINMRRLAFSTGGDRARAIELAAVVFLWQAAVGVYFLSLVQQYLPQALHATQAGGRRDAHLGGQPLVGLRGVALERIEQTQIYCIQGN